MSCPIHFLEKESNTEMIESVTAVEKDRGCKKAA
jgi:hypothetical protein